MKNVHPLIFLLLPTMFGTFTMFIPDAVAPYTEIIYGSWFLYLIGLIILSFWDIKRKTRVYRFAASFSFLLSSFYCLFPALKAFPSNLWVAILICGSWIFVFFAYFFGHRVLRLLKLEAHKRLIIVVYFIVFMILNMILSIGGGNERTARWGIEPLFLRIFGETTGWQIISLLLSFGFSHILLFPLYLNALMDVQSTELTNKKIHKRNIK